MPTPPDYHVLNSYITKPTCHSARSLWGMCVKRCWWEAGPHQPLEQCLSLPACFLLLPSTSPVVWASVSQVHGQIRFRPLLCTGSKDRLLEEWLSPSTNQVIDEECKVLGWIRQCLRQLRSGAGKDIFVKDRGLKEPKSLHSFLLNNKCVLGVSILPWLEFTKGERITPFILNKRKPFSPMVI